MEQNENAVTTTPPVRKVSLFEIVERTLAVLGEIDAADGELTAETDAALTELGVALEAKGEGYAAVYKLLNEEAEACDRFVHSYTQRAARKRRQAEVLKQRMYEAMKAVGIKKITAPTATIAIQNNSAPSLKLLVPAKDVPTEYTKTTVEPDNALIKTKLQAGESLAFATLERGEHLRFR